MPKQRKWSSVVMFVLGILCVILLIQTIGNVGLMENAVFGNEGSKLNDQKLNPFPEAKKYSSKNDTAYVFLGLGATAHQMNCPASIESLVRFAGWDGSIYLVTDDSSCFDHKAMVKNAGMKAENLKIVEVKEDFGGGGVDLKNPKVGFSKNRLKSKSMKTQLFDIITDPSVQVLAYVDCDILFVDEGCATEFVTGGVPWEEKNIRFSRVTVDPDNGKLVNVHTGTILMHREHSKEVLQRWYDRLNSGFDDMDRPSYLAEYHAVQAEIDERMAQNSSTEPTRARNASVVHNRLRAREGNVVVGSDVLGKVVSFPRSDKHYRNVMMPSERVRHNTSTGAVTHFELFVNPHVETHSCMVHVSKARCELFGRNAIQTYVNRFDLRTFRQGYKYCPNPFLAPVLYGWFPLSYLPFCPKIEQFY